MKILSFIFVRKSQFNNIDVSGNKHDISIIIGQSYKLYSNNVSETDRQTHLGQIYTLFSFRNFIYFAYFLLFLGHESIEIYFRMQKIL